MVDNMAHHMADNGLKYLNVGEGAEQRAIAVRARGGAAPGLLWLGGYKSDMQGTKAQALARLGGAPGPGLRAVRLFRARRIRRRVHRRHDRPLARRDACGVRCLLPRTADRDRLVDGRLAGAPSGPRAARAQRSSQQANAANVSGLVLVAPAIDFTEELMWKRFTPEIKRELADKGVWARPSEYSPEPYLVTRQLIEEGRQHLLLGAMIETGCPVRILQGVQDPDVPWQHAKALVARFACDDVVLTLIKDGDHRLSRPEDIERLIRAVAEL